MNTADSSTRGRILAAADALFGEIGFDAAPTRKIAERSGVNKALIHYHFASKQDLFLRSRPELIARCGCVPDRS